jgi:hypothetical protein
MMTSNRRPVRTRTLRLALAVLAGGLGLSAAARAAHAQALQQVPADALVVLKINHLDDTNGKVSALLQQLGVVDLVPQAKDPLKAFEDQTGIAAGSLDAKRDAVVYMPNTAVDPNAMNEDQPPVVMLLPVSDYKAFVAGLTDAKAEGDLTSGKFKGDDNETYVAHWGDYAAVSPKKEYLTGKHAGLSPSPAASRELEQRDLCLFVNFPALKTVLLPQLAARRKEITKDFDAKLGEVDAAKRDLGHTALDQAFNVADRFLQDADGTTVGLSIGKAGISGNLIVGFTPGSYLAGMFGNLKMTDAPLLGGLPDEKYLFFGGSIQDPKTLQKLLDDVAGPIVAKLGALGESGTKIQSLVELYKSALTSSDGGSMGLVVPTAAFGTGSLIRYVAVLRADAEKLRSAQEQMSQIQTDVMAGLGVQGAEMVKTTVTKGAKTVGGVSFDEIKSEPDPANPNAQQAQEAMRYVYGPEGMALLLGVVNEHTLVNALGMDDQLLGSVVESAKSNKDVLTAQVQAVDAEMPKQRSAVAYLDLGQFVGTALSYAHAMGMNMPVQMAPNLPPVGLSFGSDPEAKGMRFDGFMPNSLLQDLVKAGFQIYLQVPHGGGGGGL